MNGITATNYYYRLRRVREACITEYQNTQPAFVELPVAQGPKPVSTNVQPCAILKCKNGIREAIVDAYGVEFL